MYTKRLLAIHGLGGHGGWFDRLRDELKKLNIELLAIDLPGFGLNHKEKDPNSPYLKGHIDTYKEWKDYVRNSYSKLKNEYGQIDILGHSLGAVLASSIDFDRTDKLILSVPGFKGAKDTFNPVFVSKAMWHYFFDKKLLNKNVFIELPVSQKDQETPAIRDELRVGRVSQNLLVEIQKLSTIAKSKIKRIRNNVLMIQVSEDKVVDNETQDEYFELIGSENKNKVVFENTDHDWIWTDANAKIASEIGNFLLN